MSGALDNPELYEMYCYILGKWSEHCLDDLENPSEESIRDVYHWLRDEWRDGEHLQEVK